jgi:ribonuclease P protein component
MDRYNFPKEERLKRALEITALFESGTSFLVYPLKIVWMKGEPSAESPVSVAFTVSKRNFRHAVLRNRIKRIMREAYRLNRRLPVGEQRDKRLLVVFVYIARELLPYSNVSKSMSIALKRLNLV